MKTPTRIMLAIFVYVSVYESTFWPFELSLLVAVVTLVVASGAILALGNRMHALD